MRTKKDWEGKTLIPAIQKRPELKPEFKTQSGIPLERLYTPEDLSDFDYDTELGYPGEFPFTRGVQPTMYRGRYWTMRQYAGFGTAEETNERFRYLLKQGQTGLSVAFDLPTQIGYDSDDPLAAGEVGKVGVAIDSLDDMETLFKEIPLDSVSTSMTINSTAPILLALYIAVAEKQGTGPEELSGTLQNDILKEFIARGTYIYPPAPSMRLVTDVIEYCSKDVPRFNPISISGYHIREAGSTAIQEVAFTLANAIAYVEAVLERGMDVDAFAGRLSFFFNAQSDFFEEICKFRAARRLWAKIMKDRFGAKKERSMMLRFHTQTAGASLTAKSPEYNVVRVALQALASVLGGTQSLHTCAKDEALGLPTQEAAAIALATQQIIAHESSVTDVVDPLGGSYYIEKMTNEIETRVDEYLDKLDQLGGATRAVEFGYFQKEIADSAYRFQKDFEKDEQIVVGVNKYQVEEELPCEILKVPPELEKSQCQKLAEMKQKRDNEKVRAQIDKIKHIAKTNENLMPYIVEAVKLYCTVGEISHALREVYGQASHSQAV